MTTRASKQHLHTLKQIAFQRESLPAHDAQLAPDWTWDTVRTAAANLRREDGTRAVRRVRVGAALQQGVFGTYAPSTRTVTVAWENFSARALATSLHEMAHALLHHDVNEKHYRENESWIESEADLVADLVLMGLGLLPRRETQWTFRMLGNVADVAAFFNFASDACCEAAEKIYAAWRAAEGQVAARAQN